MRRRLAAAVAVCGVLIGTAATSAGALVDDDTAPPAAVTPAEREAQRGRAFLAEVAAARELVAFVEAWTPRPPARKVPDPADRGSNVRTTVTAGSGNCGGALPPCYVLERESGGDPTAENPTSSAAGKWQMLASTSANVARAMGRPDLIDVPASRWSEAEQDAGAALLWDGGAGCSHWAAC